MAVVGITISEASQLSVHGHTLPVLGGVPYAAETINSTSTSAATTITAPSDYTHKRMVWRVAATGGSVWVKTGTGTPVAAAGDDYLIPSGGVLELSVAVPSEKLAVKDA